MLSYAHKNIHNTFFIFKMSHCNHHSHSHTPEILSFLPNEIGIIALMFITGLSGSFTHCIGMCGPIAMAQMSMKLMMHSKEKLSEKQKLKDAFLLPYYLGKSITYGLIALCIYAFASSLSALPFANYVIGALLFAVSLCFILSAFNAKIPFVSRIEKKISQTSAKKFNKFIDRFKLSPYGFKGFIMGMILGTIPCGMLYAAAAASAAQSTSAITVFCAMLAFGIGTIPGLYISAYAGTTFFAKSKKWFQIIFKITMLVNAALLLKFAFKIL